MQLIPQAVVFSTYTPAFDPGLLDRQAKSPHETAYRTIGRASGLAVSEAAGIRINWPESESGRVRDLISRAGVRRRYKVPCFRDGDREAQAESEEESRLYVLLDACAGVTFQEQPATIEFELGGDAEEHLPDTLIVTDHVKVFVECKDDSEVDSLYLRKRAERLKNLLRQLDFGYLMLSNKHLTAGEYLTNAIRMRRRAKMMCDHPKWVKCVKGWQLRHKEAAASTILAELPDDQKLDALYSLLYSGDLVGDLRHSITLDMHVRPPLSNGELPWVWELFEKAS